MLREGKKSVMSKEKEDIELKIRAQFELIIPLNNNIRIYVSNTAHITTETVNSYQHCLDTVTGHWYIKSDNVTWCYSTLYVITASKIK